MADERPMESSGRDRGRWLRRGRRTAVAGSLVIDDQDRYSRLRLISWWRQERLRSASILVVGAGALGNEVMKNLALLGLGTIYLIDLDMVEPSNLSQVGPVSRAGRRPPQGRGRRAERSRELNPEITVIPIHGDVIADVGLGLFADVDLVIGCLDNREARLWVNRQCWKTSTPWIDAGIQEIQGVVKVFVPPDSACYECAMTERDYQLLNRRYSCPLLSRDEISSGKVPTAPTIASMMAALQVQEALKLLHGMPVAAGSALVYNGVANQFYTTKLPFRDDCLSHETYPDARRAARWGTSIPSLSFSRRSVRILRAGFTSSLDRELVVAIECPRCGWRSEVMRPRVKVKSAEAHCPNCREPARPEFESGVDQDSPLAAQPLSRLGIPPYDIVRVDGEGRIGLLPPGRGSARRQDGLGVRPLNGDDITFGEMKVREPERRKRPDRDRKFACLAYEVPGPADLPIFLDRRAADAIERHALSDTSVELGGILLGKECLDPATGEAVCLGHPVARGQALRQHPGQLHLHPRFVGRNHPRARPAVSRIRHRGLVSHPSQFRHLSLASRPVYSSQFFCTAAPGRLRGRPDQSDARVLPVARRRNDAGRRLLPDRRSRRSDCAGTPGQRPRTTSQSRSGLGRIFLSSPRSGADQDAHTTWTARSHFAG